MHRRSGAPALRAGRGTRAPRPAALARPARRPDDRRAPGGERLGPAPAPLRRAARRRARRDSRPGGRDRRERRRQGCQERRGLRPEPTGVWIAGPAGAHRPRQLSPAPAAEGEADARRRDGRCRDGGVGASRVAARAERARRPPPGTRRGALRGLHPSGRRPVRGGAEARRRARGRRRGLGREPSSAAAGVDANLLRARSAPSSPHRDRGGRRPSRRRARICARTGTKCQSDTW